MIPTSTATAPFHAFRDRQQVVMTGAYPELIERMGWGRGRIVAHQQRLLGPLLAHVAEHSPFHARRLAGVDLDAVSPEDLSALPVMTKAEMMEQLGDVFADPRLTPELVEHTLTTTDTEPVPIFDEYLAFASGGSSGQRGVFVYDEAALAQFLGSLSRGPVASLDQLGGPPPGGLPIAIVAAASAVHQTGATPALAEGGTLPFHFHPVPVTQPLPAIVAGLNELQPALLFGYPTILARLAAERTADRLQISPVSVTCTSETCTPDLQSAIREGFNVPLINTFGSTEGLTGTSAPDDDAIVFAEDGCIVELVDEDDRPVPVGAPSAKVLVTNLYNRVQPLIRYSLTDSFVQLPPAQEHGYLRARVQGRSDDAFHYGDRSVHPLVVRSVLVKDPAVVEYQVRQTTDGVDVTVVVEGPCDTRRLHDALVTALAGAGLAAPAVAVRTANSLARHPETGKFRRFVPLG